MTMNMRMAFDSRMLTPITRYYVTAGEFDEFNEWQEGRKEKSTLRAVVLSGNRFSQFDEGTALKATAGGERFSDYRSIHISDRFELLVGDKVGFGGSYFNVLQMSDESVFGYKSFLIEKSKDWSPQ